MTNLYRVAEKAEQYKRWKDTLDKLLEQKAQLDKEIELAQVTVNDLQEDLSTYIK